MYIRYTKVFIFKKFFYKYFSSDEGHCSEPENLAIKLKLITGFILNLQNCGDNSEATCFHHYYGTRGIN